MSKGLIFKHIYVELKEHAPFTLFGAVLGVVFMLIFRNIAQANAHKMFSVFHPTHVLLSAMTTAAMFKINRVKTNFIVVLIVGIIGAIGVATLSDSVIPFFGEKVFHLNIPTHADLHHDDGHADNESEHQCSGEHSQHNGKIYLGFIEEWQLIYSAAILGVIIAWFYPTTKFPHAAHVLISTWASSAYILMTAESTLSITMAMTMVLVLFISTWLPCCISDIVFPLLLTGKPQSCGKCKSKD